MDIKNAWNQIPLADYEQHMRHKDVAQSQLLNNLTRKYLQKHQPQTPLFLGICGGNGLEHIDSNRTKSVYGIDINKSYLDETQKRFGEKINNLILIQADISASTESFVKSDFVWAALIFEYIDMQRGFNFIANNTCDSSILIITIQSNNGNQSVSPTGIESIKAVKDIFAIVDPDSVKTAAATVDFKCIGSEENMLPNGKSFLTYAFSRQPL
jgi:hypothetical protein